MKEVIAECICDTGYGTDYYNPETFECHHEAYAGVIEVISNKKYWSRYESIMSKPLWKDFSLGWGFDKYNLKVYSDGSRKATKLER